MEMNQELGTKASLYEAGIQKSILFSMFFPNIIIAFMVFLTHCLQIWIGEILKKPKAGPSQYSRNTMD